MVWLILTQKQLDKLEQDANWIPAKFSWTNPPPSVAEARALLDMAIQIKTYKESKMKNIIGKILNFFYDPSCSVRHQFRQYQTENLKVCEENKKPGKLNHDLYVEQESQRKRIHLLNEENRRLRFNNQSTEEPSTTTQDSNLGKALDKLYPQIVDLETEEGLTFHDYLAEVINAASDEIYHLREIISDMEKENNRSLDSVEESLQLANNQILLQRVSRLTKNELILEKRIEDLQNTHEEDQNIISLQKSMKDVNGIKTIHDNTPEGLQETISQLVKNRTEELERDLSIAREMNSDQNLIILHLLQTTEMKNCDDLEKKFIELRDCCTEQENTIENLKQSIEEYRSKFIELESTNTLLEIKVDINEQADKKNRNIFLKMKEKEKELRSRISLFNKFVKGHNISKAWLSFEKLNKKVKK